MNTMKNTMRIAIAALTAFSLLPAIGQAKSDDEAKIEALEDTFAAAFNTKSVDAIMKAYVPDESLVVFDVVPPQQYVGANAYRKDWEDFFAAFQGPLKFEITDLHVVTDGTLGYGHSIQHVSGTDAKGQPIDLVVRVIDACRKVGNDWLILHEHVSVPVDLTTGKPDLASKP
jgi:ketosteroid isomerase-like protein